VVVLKKGSSPRISVHGYETGFIQVGRALPVAVGRSSEGGAVGVCGPDTKEPGLVALSYDVLRRIDEKGSLELVWASGWLDPRSCKVAITDRRVARPRHVAGGVIYAFRTHCAACQEAERDVLHALTPQTAVRFEQQIPFEHRTLALAPGRSGVFQGSTSFNNPLGGQAWGMPDWHGVIDRKCKEDSVWCAKFVHLEASQARAESAPTLFVGGDLD
jgi:hypothetical protein